MTPLVYCYADIRERIRGDSLVERKAKPEPIKARVDWAKAPALPKRYRFPDGKWRMLNDRPWETLG